MGSRQEPGAEDKRAAAPRLYLTHKASLTVSSLRAAINTPGRACCECASERSALASLLASSASVQSRKKAAAESLARSRLYPVQSPADV